MLGKIFGILCTVSVLWGLVAGRAEEMSNAVLDGAASAVTLTLTLCGMMCLWCGLMEVFRRAGGIGILSRLLMPLLRLIFPDAAASGCGIDEISANVAANLLGIGNAATPLALSAMKKLGERARARGLPPERASDDMVTLTVLNTSSVSLIPATVAALRRAAGSPEPFSIVPAVWICSLVCSATAILLARAGAADKRCLAGKKAGRKPGGGTAEGAEVSRGVGFAGSPRGNGRRAG